MRTISVFLVVDINELRDALEEIISMTDGYKCIGTSGNSDTANDRIPIARPDVVLMDINLGGTESGIDVVRVLKQKMPDTNFMMCTVDEENEKIFSQGPV